ncbi:unnamed protein product, partial [Effrenium voratum]
LVGWRANLPVYTVPVIPYLQTDLGDGPQLSTQPKELPKTSGWQPRPQMAYSDGPFVLLPDIVFQLMQHKNIDHGTLCLPLPATFGQLPDAMSSVVRQALQTYRILRSWPTDDHFGEERILKVQQEDEVMVIKHDCRTGWAYGRKVLQQGQPSEEGWFSDRAVEDHQQDSWPGLCAEEYKALGAAKEVPRMRQSDLRDPEELCECFVDVFAGARGTLRWNDKLQVGRSLMEQLLFTIDGDDDDKQPLAQYFNSADWMFADPRYQDESFDARVAPTFSFTPNKGAPNRKPRNADEIFSDWTLPPLRQWCKEGRPVKELQRAAAQYNYRLVSKNLVPERVTPFDNAKLKLHHTHTFMVDVGHHIRKDDHSTWTLARLQVGLPKHLAPKYNKARNGVVNTVTLSDVNKHHYEFALRSNDVITLKKDGRLIQELPAHQQPQLSEDDVVKERKVLNVAGREIKVTKAYAHQVDQVLELFRDAEDHVAEVEESRGHEVGPNEDVLYSYLTVKYKGAGE